MLLDEVGIKELLSILIDNAIKHSYKNSTINISLRSNGKNIILSVKNKRNNNRYGLVLATAKNIVLNHNVEISVESDNHITTFKVVFRK